MEHSREPFVAWLGDGRLLAVSPGLEALTGYSRAEVEGMRWPDDFTVPETGEMIKKAMVSTVSENEVPWRSGELIRKDGSRVNVRVPVHRYSPDESDELYFFSFLTDVTGHSKEQMALREAQANAELLLDLMSNDIDNMNRVSIRYLELVLGTTRLRPGERELIMTALGSLMNASRMIDNVRRVQGRDQFNYP